MARELAQGIGRDAVISAELRINYEVPGRPPRYSERSIIIGVVRGGELREAPGWQENLVREIQVGANLSPPALRSTFDDEDFGELVEGEVDLAPGGGAPQGTNAGGRGEADAAAFVLWVAE